MNVRELDFGYVVGDGWGRTYSNVLIRGVLDKYDYLMGRRRLL